MLSFNCQIRDSRHAVSHLKPWNRSLEIWVSWGETSLPPPALIFSIKWFSGVIAQAVIVLKQLRSWERKNGSWHQATGRSEPIPTSLSNEELWENFPARGSLGRLSSEPAAALLLWLWVQTPRDHQPDTVFALMLALLSWWPAFPKPWSNFMLRWGELAFNVLDGVKAAVTFFFFYSNTIPALYAAMAVLCSCLYLVLGCVKIRKK